MVIKKYLFLTVLELGVQGQDVEDLVSGEKPLLVTVSTSDGERVVSFFSLLFSR